MVSIRAEAHEHTPAQTKNVERQRARTHSDVDRGDTLMRSVLQVKCTRGWKGELESDLRVPTSQMSGDASVMVSAWWFPLPLLDLRDSVCWSHDKHDSHATQTTLAFYCSLFASVRFPLFVILVMCE